MAFQQPGNAPDSSPAPPPAGRVALLEAGVIFLVFFIIGGAPVPHVNESHYLTKAKHYWDAAYCPGDFFLDSADAHVVFYWTVGWLTRFFSLSAVAWIGRTVAWATIALAWQRLSYAVIPRRWAAPLSAALWALLIERANFAGEWVIGGVEAKCFAYACLLAGLAAMAQDRWRATFIWLGAASAFHVLVGAWAVLAAAVVWMTDPPGRRAPRRHILPGLVVGGLLSLPGLLPALALERGADPAVTQEAARIYVFDRLPHHLAPLSLLPAELLMRLRRFGLMAAGLVAVWAVLNRQAIEPDRREPQGLPARWQALDRLLRFTAFALVANCAGLAIEAALLNEPLLAARILRYYWFRQADVAVPLAAALGVVSLIDVLLDRRSAWAPVAMLAALGVSGWLLADISLGRIDQPAPPAVQKMEQPAAWQEACEWIRVHAPPDARFLIPRAGHSFKWYAARADVASYKDVPQDAASVVEWRDRCRRLFPSMPDGDSTMVLGSPEQWGTSRVRALARRYGATHVIARAFPPLNLPAIYPADDEGAASYYAVYETGESAVSEQP